LRDDFASGKYFGGQQQILQEKQRIHAMFQRVGDAIDSVMRPYGIPTMPHFFLDCMYLLPDIFLQFTAEALEFPRNDMPDTIRFIGPILPSPSVEFDEPDSWTELDGSRPVVLVTQGTLANLDFNEVLQPALSGLADEDITVIVAADEAIPKHLIFPKMRELRLSFLLTERCPKSMF
jgi:UDP:flavonoid glycosyltransferase YjiC (YdhE family)